MGLDATVWADDECEDLVADMRVGNVAHVSALRNEVAALEGDYRILLGGVLYSGTHCGDEIDTQEVNALQTELRQLPDGSTDLNQFKAEFLQLCEAALARGRAISFT